MPYRLGDLFIGKYPIIENYGAKPEVYSARWNIRGLNGIHWGCPSLTPILAGAAGVVLATGFDVAGYGNFIKLLHEGFLTRYGHLNDIAIKEGDKILAGQLIGHSNQTGFVDIPCLCFGVAPCDPSGNKTLKDNGFGGYIDPLGAEVEWDIKNLTEPVLPEAEISPTIPITADEKSHLQVQGNSLQTIVAFITQNGGEIDVTDPECGKKVNAFISDLLLQKISLEKIVPPTKIKKPSLFSRAGNGMINFVFAKKEV